MKLTDYTHIFIDFDETLFSHGSFIEWLSGYLADAHGIDAEGYISTFDEYHDVQDTQGFLRLYRHEAHILEKTGLSWDMLSGEIEQAVKNESLDFCYAEVHRFVAELLASNDFDIRILTYGNADYQRFKISLCKHLQALPIHVVHEPKGKFLNKHYNHESIRGVLIDDKAPLVMPQNWQHLWVNRNGRSKPKNAHCVEIVDLAKAAFQTIDSC